MFRTCIFAFAGLLLSTVALADGHGHGHGHKHHKHKHHHHDHYVEVERVYYPERVVQYVPAPVVAVPPPAPRYRSYDQRSTSGLVGGAIGSAAGYELSNGDPLGAGIGAAAGAMIGNGMAR